MEEILKVLGCVCLSIFILATVVYFIFFHPIVMLGLSLFALITLIIFAIAGALYVLLFG